MIAAGSDGRVAEFYSGDEETLPSIPDDINVTEYFTALDAHNMLHLFAALLFERRVIITSRSLALTSACVHAAEALLYPLHWQVHDK